MVLVTWNVNVPYVYSTYIYYVTTCGYVTGVMAADVKDSM